ncbi:hypothetical protein RFI_17777, partial [Reticulomyxa filosa]
MEHATKLLKKKKKTMSELLLKNKMFAKNVAHLLEMCSTTLQNSFSLQLLPRKVSLEKKKAKPVRRHVGVNKKGSIHGNESELHHAISASPKVVMAPEVVHAEELKQERRHSFSGTLEELRKLHAKEKAKARAKANAAANAINESQNANANVETKCIRICKKFHCQAKWLEIFARFESVQIGTGDEQQSRKSAMTKPEKEGDDISQFNLETMYNECRRVIQSVLLFFLHVASEAPTRNRHLEKLLPLIVEYQEELFFADLIHILTKLLGDVARYGGSDKIHLTQAKERLAKHCLNVWECVLTYQSHFLSRSLSKEPELFEKLRTISTERDLARAQTTLETIFGKQWQDRWVQEKNMLRAKVESQQQQLEHEHEQLESYRNQLKCIHKNVAYGNGHTILKELQSIEHAKLLSREHQFYYQNLFCRNKWFELIVLKLKFQSPLWLQLPRWPWDEVWLVDSIEGPHRMRK